MEMPRWPEPNADGSYTISDLQVRTVNVIVLELVNYVNQEYQRCGKSDH